MPAIDAAVAALVHAHRTGRTVAAVPLPDADAGYAVQAGVARARGWWDEASAVPPHWKSGAASRSAVQTHAPLPPAGVHPAPADLAAVAFHRRGIEAEIALRVGQDVTPGEAAALDVEGARALVDAMAVTVEIVDSRWDEGFAAPAWSKLADLQSHGALVVGAWRTFAPFAAHDWSAQRCVVTIGAAPPQEHRGTHALGDPCAVLPGWLRHATRFGHTVPAGTVVTTGTWCGLPLVAAGDAVAAEFPGIGRVDLRL